MLIRNQIEDLVDNGANLANILQSREVFEIDLENELENS